jgi:hypothetical protein
MSRSENLAWRTAKKAYEKNISKFFEDLYLFKLFVQFRSVCTKKNITIAPQFLFCQCKTGTKCYMLHNANAPNNNNK